MSELYLGIDTSNYTTSVAVADSDGNIVVNVRRLLPVVAGQRGLRQSDAVFEHVRALPELLSLAAEQSGTGSFSAIGVSATPRKREGSYMPCFLVGRAVAYAAGLSAAAPVYEFSHQCGHLMAAIYSSSAYELLGGHTFGAFHVSGGTMEMLTASFGGDGFCSEIIGGTEDISAGQLIDRVGVMLGLRFPCGAALEQLALSNERPIPRIFVSHHDGMVNLSGLENKLTAIYRDTADAAYVADCTVHAVETALSSMLSYMQSSFGELPVLFSGGVMSCKYISEQMHKQCRAFTAEPQYSSDNACGIALLCRYRHLSSQEQDT